MNLLNLKIKSKDLDWEAFCEKILPHQQVFLYFPKIYFSMKRLEIYSSLVKGNFKVAAEQFEDFFRPWKNSVSFQKLNSLFRIIFECPYNYKVVEILNCYTAQLKEILFDEILTSYIIDYDSQCGNNKSIVLECFDVTNIEEMLRNQIANLSIPSLSYSSLDEVAKSMEMIQNPSFSMWNEQKRNQDFHFKVIHNFEDNSIKYNFSNTDISAMKNDSASTLNQTNRNSSSLPSLNNLFKKDPQLNLNSHKKNIVRRSDKDSKRTIMKANGQFLKNFLPKFLKKENIAKKIFRKFRKFIIQTHVKSPINADDTNYAFLKKILQKKFIPPFSLIHEEKEYTFKSLNTQFFHILFSCKLFSQLYDDFVESTQNKLVDTFVSKYNLKQTEPEIIESLTYYMSNFNLIYVNEFNKNDKESSSVESQMDESSMSS